MKNNHESTNNESNSNHDDIAEAVSKGGEEMTEKAKDIKDKAVRKTENAWEAAKEKISEAQSTLAGYVKENPLKAVGMAAGVGVILGALFYNKN